jgi:hypothetical protein
MMTEREKDHAEKGATGLAEVDTGPAQRRAVFNEVMQNLRETAPELTSAQAAGPILADLAAAKRPDEWNSAVSRLMGWALRHTLAPDRRGAPALRVAVSRFTSLLAQGFVGPAHHPGKESLAEHDAYILKEAAASTMIEAVAALDTWDRESLLPGQELVELIPGQRKDRLRKRAMRAAAHAGITLRTRKKEPAAR